MPATPPRQNSAPKPTRPTPAPPKPRPPRPRPSPLRPRHLHHGPPLGKTHRRPARRHPPRHRATLRNPLPPPHPRAFPLHQALAATPSHVLSLISPDATAPICTTANHLILRFNDINTPRDGLTSP